MKQEKNSFFEFSRGYFHAKEHVLFLKQGISQILFQYLLFCKITINTADNIRHV